MNIIFRNTGATAITVADLAIQLEPGYEVDLASYQTRDILASTNLSSIMNSESVEVKINETLVDYKTMVAKLTNMTAADHETLKTLKHNVSEDYFFETIKNASGQTAFIVYYKDSSKALKIREEEIIRNESGNVSEIIVREYDALGIPVVVERQILNRDTSGKVENITVTT